jgi:hypothetical protein
MTRCSKLFAFFSSVFAAALLFTATPFTLSPAAAAPCNGPAGTPAPTQTVCVTAIAIPGRPLGSFGSSFVNTIRSEYYLSDQSNASIDIISTRSLKSLRSIPGFTGNNGDVATSGPNGVTAHGKWLYVGDGNATLHVIDLTALPLNNPPHQVRLSGGVKRVDKLALTSDGKILLTMQSADQPPFGLFFQACGDAPSCNVGIIGTLFISESVIPIDFSRGFQQPVWDPTTQRFYASVPIIANNPPGCNYGQRTELITCSGGLMVIDPKQLDFPTTLGLFNPTTFTGVVPLKDCGPNGSTLALQGMLMLGCTPSNDPDNETTYIINDKTFSFAAVGNITGSGEVWWNSGDQRYYLGASEQIGGPVLGVVDPVRFLLETIPVSSGSHSVAADPNHNYIFSPQVGTIAVVGPGGDATTNGARICGTSNGCIAVYEHEAVGNVLDGHR